MCEFMIFYSIYREMKKCIMKKWDGVKDQAKKNSVRHSFFKMLKRAVNAVGGNDRRKKQFYYKLIDKKSTTKAEVGNLFGNYFTVQYNFKFYSTMKPKNNSYGRVMFKFNLLSTTNQTSVICTGNFVFSCDLVIS